jgi:hypothetical protein
MNFSHIAQYGGLASSSVYEPQLMLIRKILLTYQEMLG